MVRKWHTEVVLVIVLILSTFRVVVWASAFGLVSAHPVGVPWGDVALSMLWLVVQGSTDDEGSSRSRIVVILWSSPMLGLPWGLWFGVYLIWACLGHLLFFLCLAMMPLFSPEYPWHHWYRVKSSQYCAMLSLFTAGLLSCCPAWCPKTGQDVPKLCLNFTDNGGFQCPMCRHGWLDLHKNGTCIREYVFYRSCNYHDVSNIISAIFMSLKICGQNFLQVCMKTQGLDRER